MPENKERKKEWFRSVNRPDEPEKWKYFCCKGHFHVSMKTNNISIFRNKIVTYKYFYVHIVVFKTLASC